jgi:hypothetical protein
VRVEQWDGQTAGDWSRLIDGQTGIINLVGESLADKRWTDERKQAIRNSRAIPGAAIVQAIEAAVQKPRVLIQQSAVGYYGLSRGDTILAEDSLPGDDFLASVCIDWENSTAAVEAMGVRRIVLRSSVILSTQGGALPRMLLPFKLFIGGPLGSGKQWFPWIHIEDEVKAIRFLLESESARGVYNLTAPHPLTNQDFALAVGQVMKRPAILPTPALLLEMVFGEMSVVLLDGQRAVPRNLLAVGYEFMYPEIEPALRNLLKK